MVVWFLVLLFLGFFYDCYIRGGELGNFYMFLVVFDNLYFRMYYCLYFYLYSLFCFIMVVDCFNGKELDVGK